MNDGPYRPALAEAFRQGARELQIDRLDIPAGAQVDEGEGGAFVHCRVYVGDEERLNIAEDPVFPGCEWSWEDQEAAQYLGYELSQYGDGQICIGADEEQDIFTGELAHRHAYKFVEFIATQAGHGNPHCDRAKRALDIHEASYRERLAADEADANDPAAQAFKPAD